MNPKYKQAWIEALRSGGFTQGTTYLSRVGQYETTHCCLGVLCMINNEPQRKPDSLGRCAIDGSNVHLSGSLKQKYGLDDDALEELMDMNDQQGKSFVEIADFIEKNL